MQDSASVVDKYFPVYQKHRAPVIEFNGVEGISVAMPRLKAFTEVDKDEAPLFSYLGDDEFVPNKPVPPSPISWPGGDGRGNVMNGTKGSFTQPNLKDYGPFPDFFKVGFSMTSGLCAVGVGVV